VKAQQPAQRLQKVLAQLGLASRREAEAWIRAGRLKINGTAATLGARVRDTDRIELDGRPIRRRARPGSQVLLCHRSPSQSQADLIAGLPRRAGRRFVAVSPMPRVDGGLEILTSDGALAARLQRNAARLTSEFSVRVHGPIAEETRAAILHGVLDGGERVEVSSCEPAGGEGANRWYQLVVRGASGKQVRQLFERQSLLVSRVLRVRFGPVVLERTLARGRSRALSDTEVRELLSGG
jgi:23S rRNA pseudouridine2605 synthase